MRRARFVLLVLVLGWLAGQSAHPCGPDFIVRAYLNSRFWQPLAKGHAEAGRPRPRQESFAGMDPRPRPALTRAYAAYQKLEARRQQQVESDWWDHKQMMDPTQLVAAAREAVSATRAADLSSEDREGLELLSCKIGLREAEMQDRSRLPQVKAQLRAFLAKARTPWYLSEGRGWLARVHYLLGEPNPAAKIYLRELDNPRSVFDETSLVSSLRLVFPYNGSAARLADHLEEYFDHPRNALFVVNLVTNPVYLDAKEHAARGEVGRKALAALERHEELFRRGADSEALALALMRAALYQGDLEKARVFGERLPAESARRAGPEFHWMAGVADVLSGREVEAEPHLRAVADSRRAPARYRAMARQGLIGIYLRLGRTPEALMEAVRFEARAGFEGTSDGMMPPWFEGQFTSAWLLDLPYLLDFQASDDDLRSTLARLGRRALRIDPEAWNPGGGKHTAQELLTYALAVRHARREEYAAAARLYGQVSAGTRARRMSEAARLHAAATQTGRSAKARLEARYRYAAFLADHSTQVFFNDRIWYGFQRYALVGNPDRDFCRDQGGSPFCNQVRTERLDPATRAALLEQERAVQDAQEERWRAYLLLDAIVSEAGPGELGRRAAAKAVEALDGINTERFGREREVAEGRRRLARAARS